MAPSIQLHRFLALQDKERTHIFTFLVENPQEISSFDVRSREFQFAGHRWYVYTGKPNNEYFSFYLRIVNLGKDVRVHTVYSFNVVNLVNYQNNYTYHSPPTGRVFSRDDDALSWGWKEFIRRETLLKPNGGFFFDGNKVLVELECKAYKTVFEENVELPKVGQENPYPMVHTSPFSVGGFAWQIRIFPDGPDVENRGNVALFLHCTTSNHLAKIKARFLIEGQPSPTVYEHTFPPNSISEMPSGVAFPNKGEFMKSLKENQLRVGVEFMSVTEVNEVHVTLSEPNSCPTVCVTPFEDLSGCPWVLKTLQAVKLKLKMDQNEKTTSGLMEFYHRHVMWNATLVSPGTEDVSLNVALNTKGPLVGYFGENWSDADVIKSDLAVEDLALTDNPYRTDVDDGYDRYSYVSIHVEIVSNHLLYKTPTPSPTGDRERKLLYSARKDRTQVHARYQELLRQKALLASKCQNLTRERTRLIGDEKNDVISQIVPDFSKFLSDVMLDLSQRAASKGRLQARETRVGRPYKATPQLDEKERQKKLADYRENFSLLLSDARPNLSELAVVQQYMGEFKEILTRFIEAKAAIHVSGVITSGSLGTNTTCSNRWDVDFVLLSSDLPRIGHVMWMPSFVVALAKMLEEGAIEGKLPDCSNFTYTNYSVQFKHKDVEVDILPAYDWQHEGGFDALYEELLRQRTSENLTWFCPAAAQRQKLFIKEQPDQVKDLIMVIKFWRNAADWNERKWRPTSYLLALLLIRAYENACHVVEGSLPSNKTVMKSFVKLILSTGNPRPAPMRIAWSRFYDPKDYNIEYSGSMSGECPPIVQDPANPANNVAETPVSWLPFRRMLEAWAHDLGLMESPSVTSLSTGR
ncbi:uncharacterized protein LOC143468872 isoform X1 [Clavelina lepadiformis]|uniref:uncharacterized protein LOC143468872 isoform X1 n=1 Tax=Clavelina lepadiformis TaxID=159417 RepID=UPI0040433CBC